MRFKIDWASLQLEGNLPCSGQFPSTSPPQGAYIWRGDVTEGFFALRVWGAYIWRGLYKEGLIFGILRYDQRMPLNAFMDLMT